MIFTSFTQAESGTTRKYGGTGLGLTISRELVQLFGGTLQVESTHGAGSNFYFEIPLTLPPVKQMAEAIPQAAVFRQLPMHILIAYDNKLNSFVISSFLAKRGATCCTVADGREAVMAFGEQVFNMVLLDLSMPVMDGYQALHAIRGINGNIPVLAFTAAVYEKIAADLAQNGFDDFITKPFKPAEVHQKKIGFLQRHTPERADA